MLATSVIALVLWNRLDALDAPAVRRLRVAVPNTPPARPLLAVALDIAVHPDPPIAEEFGQRFVLASSTSNPLSVILGTPVANEMTFPALSRAVPAPEREKDQPGSRDGAL